jgi:hypothetical protein
LLLLLAVAGCNPAPIWGTWQGLTSAGSTETLSFDEHGNYLERDTLYPEDVLARLDPEMNPSGYKFRGQYGVDDTLLTLDGYDGLYPQTTTGMHFRTRDTFEVVDQLLARHLFQPATDVVGVVGTWKAIATTSWTSSIVGEGEQALEQALTLGFDGRAQLVSTRTGTDPMTDTLVGPYVHDGADVIVTLTTGDVTERQVYHLLPSGALAAATYTHAP